MKDFQKKVSEKVMKYVKAEQYWNFMGHTFLRFKNTIPLFFDGAIIEGKEYMATKCFGGPPFSIDISGNYDFKDLNVGFIEPDRNEKKRLTKEALTKIREVE